MYDHTFFSALKNSNLFHMTGNPSHFFISPVNSTNEHSELILLDPGCFLAFNQVRSNHWPAFSATRRVVPKDVLFINLCLKGRCDLILSDDSFISLSEGRINFATRYPKSDFSYPNAYYDGIQLLIEPAELAATKRNFLEMTDIDLHRFTRFFDDDKTLYLQFTTQMMDRIASALWMLQKSNSVGKMRLLAALFLHECMEFPRESINISLLTKSQLCTVATCEEILCRDLSRKITLKEVASTLQVNPNSLKAWFKELHGQSVTQYMRKQRMNKAKNLLLTTDDTILSIALQVGYENPGKFSKAFREYYQLSPSAFRREKRITNLNRE